MSILSDIEKNESNLTLVLYVRDQISYLTKCIKFLDQPTAKPPHNDGQTPTLAPSANHNTNVPGKQLNLMSHISQRHQHIFVVVRCI